MFYCLWKAHVEQIPHKFYSFHCMFSLCAVKTYAENNPWEPGFSIVLLRTTCASDTQTYQSLRCMCMCPGRFHNIPVYSTLILFHHSYLKEYITGLNKVSPTRFFPIDLIQNYLCLIHRNFYMKQHFRKKFSVREQKHIISNGAVFHACRFIYCWDPGISAKCLVPYHFYSKIHKKSGYSW